MEAKVSKKTETPVFRQIIDMIPSSILASCIKNNKSDKHCFRYRTYDQLISMMYGQLNRCHSLREISLGINQSPEFLFDIGLFQSPARSTMSDGNEKRNYKVFEQLYLKLLQYYATSFQQREGYKIIEEIKGKSIKIIDSTLMSVCLQLFSWAQYRTAKGGIKAHVSLDEGMMLPDMVNISEAKLSDRRGADGFRYPAQTIVVDDRGYFDTKLFKQRIDDENFIVCRIKDNTLYEVIEERELPEKDDQHILLDEEIRLTGKAAIENGMRDIPLRRVVVFIEDEKGEHYEIEVITNNMEWKASTIAELYKRRWIIEVFFKFLKQNLQIKTFIGTSENACKSQIWIALIAYLLLELIRRVMCKSTHRFGHLVTLIRVTLTRYNSLNYILNETTLTVRNARKHKDKPPNLFSNAKTKIILQPSLFDEPT